ncbi:GTP pyrophosphokinase [Desulfospira joergensenii]|uniref:GTP pyrophosphokinase n=1 Tax=Desulfospira joergensenii TaxID=53329 RepID=UPI0003B4B575|nr:hypothetical protein [Desulfospira joergensenii]
MDLKDKYLLRYTKYLKSISKRISKKLSNELEAFQRIDRIIARPKSLDRFIIKAQKEENGSPKYSDPLNQIQDQIGARIIVFYLEDVEVVASEIEAYYRSIEKRQLIPESENEFGYVGKHYVLMIPEDVVDDEMDRTQLPEFFELQIKTLFQHAWSEANHDLGYKQDQPLTSHQKRKLAFTAAQAWGADLIFSELHSNL